MNEAVFISDNSDPKIKEAIGMIKEKQMELTELNCRMEQRVGVLELKAGGAEVTASKEEFDDISEKMKRNLNDIWKCYEKLHDLGAVKII